MRRFALVLVSASLLPPGCGERAGGGAEAGRSGPPAQGTAIESARAERALVDLKDRDAYAAWKAVDGDPATAWAEGDAGPGTGQTLAVEFNGPVEIGRIDRRPGYYDEKWYAKNNRLRPHGRRDGGGVLFRRRHLPRSDRRRRRARVLRTGQLAVRGRSVH